MHPETTIHIPDLRTDLLFSQFHRENESVRRTLAFLIEEDIILKAGISEVLKNMNPTDEGILKRLEHFHNRLLKENDTVRTLRAEVADMDKQLDRNFCIDKDLSNSIRPQQQLFRKKIKIVELEFLKLKFDFNEYVEEILQ
ncbi:MAG: hypothetical protein ABI325_03955 [Ginsengibacter sp.]